MTIAFGMKLMAEEQKRQEQKKKDMIAAQKLHTSKSMEKSSRVTPDGGQLEDEVDEEDNNNNNNNNDDNDDNDNDGDEVDVEDEDDKDDEEEEAFGVEKQVGISPLDFW